MLEVPPKTTLTSALHSMFDPLSFFLKNLLLYPDIFSSGLLGFSAYVLNKPEYIKQVLTTNQKNYLKGEKYGILKFLAGKGLVTNEGQHWLKQRRLIQPYFYHQSIEGMMKVMQSETEALLQRIDADKVFNISEAFGKLTINIVGKAMFGTDAEGKIEVIRTEMDAYQKIGNILLRIPFRLPKNTPEFPLLIRMKRSIQRLDKIVMEIIEKRRSDSALTGDLLDLMMRAEDAESSERMDNKQLRDEVLTLFLAGHETTLLALSWTFYLLAKHPRQREKAYVEVCSVWGDDSPFTFEHARGLTYVEQVINESMRLYPPAYIIARKAKEEDHIGPYHVPANKDVFINVYGLHRHPQFWEDAQLFNPERFAAFEHKGINKYVFLPFGGGPRHCIGDIFSMVEMKIIIASFLKKFDFSYPQKVTIKPKPLITLKPDRDIEIQLRRRQH